jgi:hypothetical protein
MRHLAPFGLYCLSERRRTPRGQPRPHAVTVHRPEARPWTSLARKALFVLGSLILLGAIQYWTARVLPGKPVAIVPASARANPLTPDHHVIGKSHTRAAKRSDGAAYRAESSSEAILGQIDDQLYSDSLDRQDARGNQPIDLTVGNPDRRAGRFSNPYDTDGEEDGGGPYQPER